jgi:hypothetical protein
MAILFGMELDCSLSGLIFDLTGSYRARGGHARFVVATAA